MKAIHLKDVSFRYGQGPDILHAANLEIESGEIVAIIGPNGCGKTTLLRLMLGLMNPVFGTISVLGETPKKARQRIGYVPQKVMLLRDFPITVSDVIGHGRLKGQNLWQRLSKADRMAVDSCIDLFELEPLRNVRLNELSGGWLQRTLIARAWATDPSILMLDEPTSSVDPHAKENIFNILKSQAANVTVVVVSHDLGFVGGHVEKIACVNQNIVSHKPTDLTPQALRAMYGDKVHMVLHDHGGH